MTELVKPPEKLLVRVLTRSFGVIQSHSYDKREQLLATLFGDRVKDLVHYAGVDEFEQQVDHYLLPEGPFVVGDRGVPEIGGLIVARVATGKITPVDLRFHPGEDPRRG